MTQTSIDAAAPTGAETPSGKGAADENFPVGSILLPKGLRPHVARFYAFARAIDDVADNPALPADEKIRRLEAFDLAQKGDLSVGPGFEKGWWLHESLAETGVSARHASDLVAAFKQDAVKNRYDDWDDLVGYCEKSANPVGRYLLDLHREDPSGYVQSDALCTVLQIVNHLQDCADDRRAMDRVYIPEPWLQQAGGGVEDLDGAAATPALRSVMDRMLDGCEVLMAEASRLPAVLKSRRLAMESAVIIRLANRLIVLLRNGDPVATRVALSKIDFAKAGVGGAVSGFFAAGASRTMPKRAAA